MAEKKRIGALLPERMAIPAELIPGVPVVELAGFHTASVDGHRGILHYSEARIDIMTRIGTVVMEGDSLQLKQMDREKIVVEGNLSLIRLERNGV